MYYSKDLMEKQKQTMFSSKKIENFLSNLEFDSIYKISKELEQQGSVLHSGQLYTKFDYYKSDLYNLLSQKFESIIGKHFVYLATIANTKGNPVLVHTDHNLSNVRENSLPYATLCIPLEVVGENNDWGMLQ